MNNGNINKQSDPSAQGQLLVYAAEDGRIKIDVRLENETVWLTQQHMAELFQTSKQNIGQHLKRVFSEGELIETSVVKNFFTTAADGKSYRTNFYNLDAISESACHRIWRRSGALPPIGLGTSLP